MKVPAPFLFLAMVSPCFGQWSVNDLPTEASTYLWYGTTFPGDYNSDGAMDLLMHNGTNQLISWLENPTGGAWVEHTVASISVNPTYCQVLDVNLDGHLDVVTSHHNFSTETEVITWYENDGAGGGWTPHTFALNLVFWDMKGLQVVDLDGDGDQELVMILVLLGVNDSQFLLYEASPTGLAYATTLGFSPTKSAPIFADFDGDGDLDVGGLDRQGNAGTWAANQSLAGSWSFGPSNHPMPVWLRNESVDWDGDGDQDLILSDGSGMHLSLNDGTGSFGPEVPMLTSLPSTGGPIRVGLQRSADMDGDGDKDLVFGWNDYIHYHGWLSYFVNEGDGTFSNRVDIRSYTPNDYIQSRNLVDFEGDGDMDVVEIFHSIGQNNRLQWLRNDRTFGQPVTACPGLANSTGQLGSLEVAGSETVAVNHTTLTASGLPLGQFTLFLVGGSAGTGIVPLGSQGRLCLNSALGRFNRMGELRLSDAAGRAQFTLDLNDVPSSTGSTMITAGETRVFQAWHRDLVGGASTSNFTDAVELIFQ
ncbi:MAG: VCBS repeat-containing protein, partial [Planctomycetota bacterium]|nr:VCBS repeat-containing protein [Planctomycetota bacterium]